MNTSVKVILLVLAALLALKFMPLLMALMFVVGVFLLAAGGTVIGGVAAIASVGLAALIGLLIAGIVLLAVLSPIWIPLLLIVGLVALIARAARA